MDLSHHLEEFATSAVTGVGDFPSPLRLADSDTSKLSWSVAVSQVAVDLGIDEKQYLPVTWCRPA